jgi:CRP/FNR family cyclic AMP-dependent transcriptional regulator
VAQQPFQNFTVRFQQGDPVFDEGDKGRSMFIVQSGRVTLFQSVNGERQPLGTMEKGDFFGEMSILEGMPRTASAVAEEDAEVIEINHSVFDKMIRGNIEIAVRMLRKLSIRLREAEGQIADLKSGGSRPAPTTNPTRGAAASAPAPAAEGARFEMGDQCFPLLETDSRIGRFDPVTQQRPEIDLGDLDLKRSVSRQHARISKGESGYTVTEEIGALTATLLNDVKLQAGVTHPLGSGDRLTVGDLTLVFHC